MGGYRPGRVTAGDRDRRLGQGLAGADGGDDVADGLAGCGGVGLVVEERFVGGVGVTVETVGRQGGQLVLLGLPLVVVVALVGGEDDQRLTVAGWSATTPAASPCSPATNSSMKLAEVVGGRGVGARLVPGAWRKTAVGRLGDQASDSEVGRPWKTTARRDGGPLSDPVSGWQGGARFGCGGVQEHQAGDLIRELRGEAEDVQAAERVTGQHVRSGNVGTIEQRVQVRGDLVTVLRTVRGVAPPPTGAVIDADGAVAGHGGRDPPRSEETPP